MPQNVLIVALGEYPAVVTGMVKALQESKKIDIVHVLRTKKVATEIEDFSFNLIKEQLQGITIKSKLLPFSDTNNREHTLLFLNELTQLMEEYADETKFNVLLSLASGRKSMSALMALMTQFFPAIKGLYHLLDKHENSRSSSLFSAEYLYNHWHEFTQEQKGKIINPSLENLILVEIPYPRAFAESLTLWEAMRQLKTNNKPLPIAITPEAEDFWRAVAIPQQPREELAVWLSSTAIKHYESLGSEEADRFWTCFRQMRDPELLKKGWHHEENGLSVYKRTGQECLLFYTKPNSIIAYPQKSVKEVIICGLSDESAIEWQAKNASREEPDKQLRELNTRERILLVPLGNSPMIATQTYTLLQESEAEGRPKITMVAVLHTKNPNIVNGVNLLKQQFRLKGVEFKAYSLPIEDVDSTENCQTYIEKLRFAIRELQQKYPTHQIELSLTGGRKGMSALTIFAAQYEGIERVYYTLINDAELEKQIEQESPVDKLPPNDKARARILFLDNYDKSKFVFFPIPLISLSHRSND